MTIAKAVTGQLLWLALEREGAVSTWVDIAVVWHYWGVTDRVDCKVQNSLGKLIMDSLCEQSAKSLMSFFKKFGILHSRSGLTKYLGRVETRFETN